MNVREIVAKYLDDNGFDGLCDPKIKCGCSKDDLCPCGAGIPEDCIPGYKIPGDSEYDFVIVKEKPEKEEPV